MVRKVTNVDSARFSMVAHMVFHMVFLAFGKTDIKIGWWLGTFFIVPNSWNDDPI